VGFGGGTYVFCVRLPRAELDPRLVGKRKEKLSGHELLRRKQLQLEKLVQDDWTRVDPWTVDIPKEKGLQELAALVRRAAKSAAGQPPRPGRAR
jgi:hypothetical protein